MYAYVHFSKSWPKSCFFVFWIRILPFSQKLAEISSTTNKVCLLSQLGGLGRNFGEINVCFFIW